MHVVTVEVQVQIREKLSTDAISVMVLVKLLQIKDFFLLHKLVRLAKDRVTSLIKPVKHVEVPVPLFKVNQ